MHLKRHWLRAIVHLSALSALPFTLPCLAQDGAQGGARQGEHTAGLQDLPDHELLAVHGAGLDDATLGRMRTTQQQQQQQQQQHTQREKERQDTNTRDTAQAAQAAQSAQTAQSQLLANTLSRQAVQMESALALAGASTAVRAAQIGVAQVTQVALVAPVMSTMSLPLMGMPMLPMRP